MQKLTDQGWNQLTNIAGRYGVSSDAALTLLAALQNNNGTMAQFNIQELGGGGQWMAGGMTMVGDMFNNSLKSKVDGLCQDLSQLLRQNPFAAPDPSQHSSQQSHGGGHSGNWWPGDLGSPNSSGGQNNMRYAYFANARRLAVDVNGKVTVYDTLNHQIGGVQQQQGSNDSFKLTSQMGTVDLSSLPVVSGNR